MRILKTLSVLFNSPSQPIIYSISDRWLEQNHLYECSSHARLYPSTISSIKTPKGKKINLKKRWLIHLKEIQKDDVRLLEKRKIIYNSSVGYVDKFGNVIGFYRTRNKRYIEDKYADIAKKLKNNT